MGYSEGSSVPEWHWDLEEIEGITRMLNCACQRGYRCEKHRLRDAVDRLRVQLRDLELKKEGL